MFNMEEIIKQLSARKKHIIIAVAGLCAGAILSFAIFWYFGDKVDIGKKVEIKNTASQQTSGQLAGQPADIPDEKFVVEETAIDIKEMYGDQKVSIAEPEKLPESKQFASFAYDKNIGKQISISGACFDFYYAFIVFKSADDYKSRPDATVVNRAVECPENKKFSFNVDLKDFNLSSGEYYFFIADQGKSGGWYNPR